MNKLLAMTTFVRVAESSGFTAAVAQLFPGLNAGLRPSRIIAVEHTPLPMIAPEENRP